MKIKKILCFIMTAAMLAALCLNSFAADPDKIPELKEKFKDGVGPAVNGLSVDYVYYEPENTQENKLPLVIYFHGAGQGSAPRAQIEENNFPLWASREMQERFTGGGAYLLVPRSHEENGEFWSDKYVVSVKATIDDFIAEHKDCIDITRIYVGGFSMGGKMTLKMASSYPSLFAAAFPLCPAYAPDENQIAAVADLPVWLIVSRFDIIAGYYTFSQDIWNMICKNTNRPKDCRLSLFGRVKYPDGKPASSNHFVWFALSNDLFTYDGGEYPNAVTEDAEGNPIELKSPDGVISWLCKYTSDFSGESLEPNGTLDGNPDEGYSRMNNIFRALFPLVGDAVKSLFTDIFKIIFIRDGSPLSIF